MAHLPFHYIGTWRMTRSDWKSTTNQRNVTTSKPRPANQQKKKQTRKIQQKSIDRNPNGARWPLRSQLILIPPSLLTEDIERNHQIKSPPFRSVRWSAKKNNKKKQQKNPQRIPLQYEQQLCSTLITKQINDNTERGSKWDGGIDWSATKWRPFAMACDGDWRQQNGVHLRWHGTSWEVFIKHFGRWFGFNRIAEMMGFYRVKLRVGTAFPYALPGFTEFYRNRNGFSFYSTTRFIGVIQG